MIYSPRRLDASNPQMNPSVGSDYPVSRARAGYDEVGRMSNVIAFPMQCPTVAEAEGLPDHIGAMQAKMFLAVFELKDSINELTRLVETDEHSSGKMVGD